MSEAPVFDETKKQYIPSANRTAIENITSQNRADGPCAGCRFELAPTAILVTYSFYCRPPHDLGF
jgi:hypothetical protein